MVGMPEGEFFLAHACVYLAQAPKSNAVYTGKEAAKAAVENAPSLEVPLAFRNAPVKAMKEQHGYHVGYQYPHDSKGAVVSADYFPIGFTGNRNFYEPTERGFEAEIRERIQRVKQVLNT
jgi:putative ATPase